MSGPFPLPVSPFEFAMLVDDRPTHPMTFGVRLVFDRPLDFPYFNSVVRDVARRYPRLVGRVEGIDAARPASAHWLATDCEMPCVRGPLPDRPRPIDLVRGPGIQLTMSADGEVLLEFHHACIDGLGVLMVLSELFGHPVPNPTNFEQTPVDYLFALRRIAAFFRRRPRPLAAPAGPAGGSAWHWASLTTAETEGIVIEAKRKAVTVNDLLVRELFLTLESWNAVHGHPGGVLRICVPMNARSRGQIDPANNVTMVTLDRIVRRTNPPALLHSVSSEMALVRRERGTHPALLAMDALAQVPGGIRAVYAANRCQSTATISNLGVVFEGRTASFAGATLRDIHFLPPVRPLTRLVVVVLTYAGRLCLGAATDQTAFSAHDGRKLFDTYMRQLRAFSNGRAL